jgi:hypothetical protein
VGALARTGRANHRDFKPCRAQDWPG